MSIRAYKREEQFHNGSLRFYFESIGVSTIVKAIDYAFLGTWSGMSVYNLGFGDYVKAEDKIVDSRLSNNGDLRAVFGTVLNSIPDFFDRFPGAVLHVQGSDSSNEFIEECKKNCQRKCVGDECKKAGRRIAIYRGYVDENLVELTKSYQFWGVLKSSDTAENYQVAKDYDVILVRKK